MPDSVLVFPLLGIVAGLLAGLLGIGGGLVLVAALVWLLPLHGIPADAAMHAALATSMASIVMTAMSSAWSHHRRGSVLWPTVRWMIPGLLLGGWLGSLLAVALDGAVLALVVSGYCFVAGAQLAFGKPRADGGDAAPRGPAMTALGTVVGAVSALVGIGGGSMTVPVLVWRGVAPVRAVGTSSACGVAIGIGSALGYALNAPAGALPVDLAAGYIYLPAAIGVAVASVLAAPWGTRLAHAISGPTLRKVFATFLVLVGATLLFQAR